MQYVKMKALAKINLSLDVLAKREDGYHDVKMVMQTVALHDKVKLTKIDGDSIEIISNLHYLPHNSNNIAYKAAQMLREEFNIQQGVHIKLDKRIPVAAGLAGGSSNAAAVLKGMNKLFHLGLTLEELQERGAKLGADVPYCLMQGTAIAEGIGEQLTSLPSMPRCHIVIAKPPISVSTKRVYEALDAGNIDKHPDTEALIGGLEFNYLEAVASSMGNVLEDVTIPMHPEIEEIKKVMMDKGALNAMMSGSGPSVFGIFKKESEAKAAIRAIRDCGLGKQAELTRPYNITRR